MAVIEDAEVAEIYRGWRAAVAARSRARGDPHAWANAEMAVRFWRLVASDLRARRPKTASRERAGTR